MSNPVKDMMGGVFEIAMAIVGIGLIALLINRSSDTSRVVTSSSNALANLLRVVTLQGGAPTGGGGILL